MKNVISILAFVITASSFQNVFSQVKTLNGIEHVYKSRFKSSKPPTQISVSKETVKELLK